MPEGTPDQRGAHCEEGLHRPSPPFSHQMGEGPDHRQHPNGNQQRLGSPQESHPSVRPLKSPKKVSNDTLPSIQYYFAKYPVLLWEVTNDAFSGQFYRDISHLPPSSRFSTQTESVVSMAKCILKCETVARGVWEMSLSPKRCQT